MTDVLQNPYTQAFARALVHFLWQGAVIGLAGYVLLRLVNLSARARHATGISLLAMMLAAPLATTWHLARERSTPVPAAPVASLRIVEHSSAASVPLASATAPAPSPAATPPSIVSPAVVIVLWLSGVIILSIRLVGGWFVARRMVSRAVQLASPEIQGLARRLAGRLALDRVVRVVESSTVGVPMMIGWIKPVVILPTAALAGLTPLQVEALLAHELAHVFRHDYLVNLLQCVVETALFYNPAVWWISSQVRAAREQCCDDLAIGVCDRLVYATALAELAAMTTTPRLALAAADGSLADRVRRILGNPAAAGNARVGWIPVALLALLLAGVAPAVWTPAAHAAGDQSGVQGPVVSGVPGGVVTGTPSDVTGGVTVGVPGGVQGGVVTGVPGGVVKGIVGGVSDGAAAGTGQEQSTTGTQTAQRTEEQIAALKALLDDAKGRLERTRMLAEKGIVSADQLRQAEMNLERLKTELSQGATASDSEAARQKLIEAEKNIERMYAKLLSERDSRALEKQTTQDEQLTMYKQLLERAQQHLASAKIQVQVGTMAGIDLRTLEEAVARVKAAFDKYLSQVGREPVSEAAAGELQAWFTEALKRLNLLEYQFNLGVTTPSAVSQATLDALAVLQGKAPGPVEARPEAPALSAPAAALRDRILREGATMSDDAVIGVLKDAAKLAGDSDRAEVLIAVARQQALTPEMVSLFVSAASGIRSEDERARVFKQPVRLRQGKGR